MHLPSPLHIAHSTVHYSGPLPPFPRHGTCSGLDQLSYFMTIYQASLNNNLMATLAAGQVTPSNSKQYRVDQVGGTRWQVRVVGAVQRKEYAASSFVWNHGERRRPMYYWIYCSQPGPSLGHAFSA